MTTATLPDQAPAETASPAEPTDLSALLYDTKPDVEAATPESTPAPTQDTGHTPPAEKPDASPPADAKVEPPAAKEDEKDKQLAAQRAAAGRLGKEVSELKTQIAEMQAKNRELEQKADGTWKEPVKPTAEQIAAQAEWKGRELASRPVAYGLYGEDEVEKQVYTDDGPYAELVKAKPWTHIEITRDPQPAVAAMRAIEREAFTKKYGDDPRQWVAKIEAELKPKHFDEFKKQAATPPVGEPVPSVSGGRGSGGMGGKVKSIEDHLYG